MSMFELFKAVFALLFVLGLIAGMAWAIRCFGPWRLAGPGRGRERRLAVVEAMALDSRYRLVLVRRDGSGHLLLLGPQGATLVERGVELSDEDIPENAV